MKRILVFIAVFFFSGCLVRSFVADQSRVDLDGQGNHGYVVGSGQDSADCSTKSDKRKVWVWEWETGSHRPKAKAPVAEDTSDYTSPAESTDTSADYSAADNSTEVEPAAVSESSGEKEYIVEKNDTLQKISQKFYGTTKKWMKIFEYNKDNLSAPDKIYPGKVIKIPDLD